MDEFERLERLKQEARDEKEGERSITLKSCLFARGSHTNFSTFPPTRKPAATIPISTQAKMKVNPTPLKETETGDERERERKREVDTGDEKERKKERERQTGDEKEKERER